MGRGKGKLKLELIGNLKARSRYFVKRKKSVEKSAKELSTLCGIQVGMLFYSRDQGRLTPTTWSSQPGALAELIASFLAAGPNIKINKVSDFLKEKMESEEGRAMEEEGKLDRAMDGKSDRAMVVDELDRAVLVAEIGEEGGVITESSSSGLVDQEMWTYEQLSAANFDCYSDPMMSFGGGGDLESSSNGGGMCAYVDPFETPLGSSYDFGSEFLDFDSFFSSEGQGSEFLDLDSCFSPSLVSEQSGGDTRFMSPCVLSS